jgi:hypothetical protein
MQSSLSVHSVLSADLVCTVSSWQNEHTSKEKSEKKCAKYTKTHLDSTVCTVWTEEIFCVKQSLLCAFNVHSLCTLEDFVFVHSVHPVP